MNMANGWHHSYKEIIQLDESNNTPEQKVFKKVISTCDNKYVKYLGTSKKLKEEN